MVTKGLDYNKDLDDKAEARFERIDSSFEKNSVVAKMLSNSIACYRELVRKRRSQLILQMLLS